MDFKMKDAKKKGKDPKDFSKKKQYYVQYLGWKECRGLGGREYTEPIVKDLVIRRKRDDLPKLTIEVTKKELKIVQLVPVKKGKTEKVKYPTVPIKDVSYATQGLSPDEDVVACIYLGFNPTTRCAVHVHVYRCDSAATSDLLVRHLNSYITRPEQVERMRMIEQELVVKGEVTPRPRGFFTAHDGLSTVDTIDQVDDNDLSSEGEDDDPSVGWPGWGHSGGGIRDMTGGGFRERPFVVPGSTDRPGGDYRKPTRGRGPDGSQHSGSRHSGSHDSYHDEPDDIDPATREKEEKLTNLAAELKQRLGNKNEAPLLLPAQDYDTVHRKQGNLIGIEHRRCRQEAIVGNVEDDSAKGDSEHGSSPRDHRHSNGGWHGDSSDVLPTSPRWKVEETYIPPLSERERGRAVSPSRGRAVSPGRDPRDRAISPGRDPRDRAVSPGRRPLSPSRGYNTSHEGGKKYTASKLGLAAGRLPRQPSDDGYTSMDRELARDFPQGYARHPDPGLDLSASAPDYMLRQQMSGKKKGGRKSRDYEEPRPDYTVGPSASMARSGSSGSFNNYRL